MSRVRQRCQRRSATCSIIVLLCTSIRSQEASRLVFVSVKDARPRRCALGLHTSPTHHTFAQEGGGARTRRVKLAAVCAAGAPTTLPIIYCTHEEYPGAAKAQTRLHRQLLPCIGTQEMHLKNPPHSIQTGERVTSLDTLQDIDELHVVEVCPFASQRSAGTPHRERSQPMAPR